MPEQGPIPTGASLPEKTRAILVRELRPGSEDIPILLSLIEALADYEHLDPPDQEAKGRLARDAAASNPPFSVLLGEIDGTVVGYALYFETYSTFLARPSLYLEDIFVLPEARGRGVGSALFQACASEAVRRGCARMEWQVLAWNETAIRFYARQGARDLQEWRSCRLDGDALLRAARP